MSPTRIREPCVDSVTIAEPNCYVVHVRATLNIFLMRYSPYFRPSSTSFSFQYRRSSVPSQHPLLVFLGKPLMQAVHHQSPSKPVRVNVMVIKYPHTLLTLCTSSNCLPSSRNLYTLKNPVEHVLGDNFVSAAVPTTRCNSLPFALNGTTARENADSLPSNGTTEIVFPSTGSIIRILDAQVPLAAFGRPNTSGDRLRTSWSIALFCWRYI